MPECEIAGIPVNFPFEPYDVQKAYMEKVICCLRDGTNGVLESPTGTGKTLSLLCSSLAWLLSRKNEIQTKIQKSSAQQIKDDPDGAFHVANGGTGNNWGIPKIIYASRTHSQLTQAMQELKRTSYSFMRAVVLGSRDQMCIHPEVMKEQGNSVKTQMCKLRVQTKTCSFHSRVESRKDHPDVRGQAILDIEDLVKMGQKLKVCPYYISKELVGDADITFMPYNYLLDPKARKANKIELKNAIVILDEAHNVDKICEESASVQLRSSDIALAIENLTHIMKLFTNTDGQDYNEEPKDFTLDDLVLLKEMLLDLEKAVDSIVVENKIDGTTFPASFMFELLEKANFNARTAQGSIVLLEKLVQFLTIQSQNSMFRKDGSFLLLADLLTVVYVNKEDLTAKLHRSFKVHVQIEETKQQTSRGGGSKDGWLSKATTTTTTSKMAKIINFWCFNPGFGMEQLLNKNARSIILTSGTLAPLKPLIAELDIPIAERLENPHIVSSAQVYVKIIGSGPDREQLISNYANRDNPKYISSLGQTVLNVSRVVPDGLLIFFPSYTLLNQCVNSWQASGLWSDISRHKPIFVEPRSKDEFANTMEQFYQNIRESKGACFIAVCRGKVSEGLDFADRNGRAVIITGLPFPPLKDPKIILKKRYLDDNRTKENELMSGNDWYSLDATRAVNQAIGRVIRHRNDYGAILLCDSRFQQPSQVQQLSKWIRNHLGSAPKSTNFGPIVRELREFFKNAENTIPKPKERSIESLVKQSCEEAGIVQSPFFDNPNKMLELKSSPSHRISKTPRLSAIVEKTNSIESWTPEDYTNAAGRTENGKAPSAMDFMSRLNTDTTCIDFNNMSGSSCSNSSGSTGLVKIHNREANSSNLNSSETRKRKRFKLVENTDLSATSAASTSSLLSNFAFGDKPRLPSVKAEPKQAPEERVEFLKILRSSLSAENFSAFTAALISYKREDTFNELMKLLLELLGKPQLHYMLLGMRRFLKNEHKIEFDKRVACIL